MQLPTVAKTAAWGTSPRQCFHLTRASAREKHPKKQGSFAQTLENVLFSSGNTSLALGREENFT